MNCEFLCHDVHEIMQKYLKLLEIIKQHNKEKGSNLQNISWWVFDKGLLDTGILSSISHLLP